VRYYFARDPKFDPFQFSPEKFAGRIKEISEMFDTPTRTFRLSKRAA